MFHYYFIFHWLLILLLFYQFDPETGETNTRCYLCNQKMPWSTWNDNTDLGHRMNCENRGNKMTWFHWTWIVLLQNIHSFPWFLFSFRILSQIYWAWCHWPATFATCAPGRWGCGPPSCRPGGPSSSADRRTASTGEFQSRTRERTGGDFTKIKHWKSSTQG